MFDRRRMLAVALGAALVLPRMALANDLIDELDKDHSGSIDLAEAKAAAGAVFDKLDKNKDGTLSQAELKDRLSPADFKAADPDGSGALTRAEFIAYAEVLFKQADTGHDGTLTHDDLKTPAGQSLSKLLGD